MKEELERNPYRYICNYAESLYPHVGRKSFEILALSPVSLIMPDIPFGSKTIRSNIHTILLTASGGGKCLAEDTLVQLSDGSSKKIKEIKKGDTIFSMDEDDFMLKKSKVLDRIYNGRKEVFQLILRSGRELLVTSNHPFFTIKDWCELKELVVGDYIAVPRILKIEEKMSEIRDCEIKLLAYLLADGHIGKNKIMFTNEKRELLDEFNESIKEFSDNLKTTEYEKKENNTKTLQISCINQKIIPKNERKTIHSRLAKNDLIVWLNSFGLLGKNSYTKHIPEDFMRLSDSKIALFLNRIFSCDGSIQKLRGKLGIRYGLDYSSCSIEMIHQIQRLLLRFGVLSKIRKKKTKCGGKYFYSYSIEIRDIENMKRFIRNVGLIKGKEKRCVEILNLNKKGNTNIDLVPKIREKIIKHKKESGKKWKDIINGSWKKGKTLENKKIQISRQLLQRLQPKGFEKFYNNDIFWDKIIEIKKFGKKKVYDLEIEGNHNFVANDIVVHNSSIAELFSKFALNTLKMESVTSAGLESAIMNTGNTFSLIVGDFARMSRDPILMKVLEGILGEEKSIKRKTARKDLDIDVNAVALLCGVSSDLSKYIMTGMLWRLNPIMCSYSVDEHRDVGKHLMKKVGVVEENGSEENIIQFYRELLSLQASDNKIIGYDIPKKFALGLEEQWNKLTEPYVKELGLNFFRELMDGLRFLLSHAFLNVRNREVKDSKLVPNEEDYEVAIRLMKQSIKFKFRLIRSESFAKGLKDAKDFKKIMESDRVPEQVKDMIRNLVDVKNNKVIMK